MRRRFAGLVLCFLVVPSAVGYSQSPQTPADAETDKNEAADLDAVDAGIAERREKLQQLLKAHNVQGADDPRVKNIKQYYGKQLELLLRMEMHFVRVVCQPTKREYDQILADGRIALDDLALEIVAATFGFHLIGRVDGRVDHPPLHSRDYLGKHLLSSVSNRLSKEKADAYRQRIQQRADARKRAILHCMVAQLDERAAFSEQQRQQVFEALAKNWRPIWDEPRLVMYGDLYMPELPISALAPILSVDQMIAFRELNNSRRKVSFGFVPGRLPDVELPEEKWEDDDSATSAAGEAKTAK